MRTLAITSSLLMMLASTSCTAESGEQPLCSQPEDSILVLEAQSVPSATRLPCIAELPIGWRFGGSLVRDDVATFWLDHDRAGYHAVEVQLVASCNVTDAVDVPPAPDEVGLRAYQQPLNLVPFTGSRILVFDGGCIVHRYRFAEGSESSLVIEADRAVSTLPRATIVSEVRRDLDLTVCGADAPPCIG